MSTSQDVLKKIAEDEVKFVDFRFTDTMGKEQHVSVPVSQMGPEKFTDGHAFDGSSIAGWKGIEASDMLLIPDPNTAHMDPVPRRVNDDSDLRCVRTLRHERL